MKTLFVIGHPQFNNSTASKTITAKIEKINNVICRNLIELYPTYKINVQKEQTILLNTDLIIFQFPIYWASMPAILKLWIDEVFTNGFAFGSDYKLKGKKILVSATLSGKDNLESNRNVLNKILFPFKGLAKFCKMDYLEPLILYEMNYSLNKPTSFFIEEAEKYSEKLLIKMKSLKNENN
jgi:putative NADPH-quinone reductase